MFEEIKQKSLVALMYVKNHPLSIMLDTPLGNMAVGAVLAVGMAVITDVVAANVNKEPEINSILESTNTPLEGK